MALRPELHEAAGSIQAAFSHLARTISTSLAPSSVVPSCPRLPSPVPWRVAVVFRAHYLAQVALPHPSLGRQRFVLLQLPLERRHIHLHRDALAQLVINLNRAEASPDEPGDVQVQSLADLADHAVLALEAGELQPADLLAVVALHHHVHARVLVALHHGAGAESAQLLLRQVAVHPHAVRPGNAGLRQLQTPRQRPTRAQQDHPFTTAVQAAHRLESSRRVHGRQRLEDGATAVGVASGDQLVLGLVVRQHHRRRSVRQRLVLHANLKAATPG
eukprot:scaffold736_cov254-Pinguiococcus_pyrenoidosus.AAC.13